MVILKFLSKLIHEAEFCSLSRSQGRGGQLVHNEIQEGIINANNIGEQFKVCKSIPRNYIGFLVYGEKLTELKNWNEISFLQWSPS